MLQKLLPGPDARYAMLRNVSGLAFSFHGMQKVFGVLGGHVQTFPSQLWVGGVIELVTGLLIAAGRGFCWAALLASGTMAVAYIQFHWKLALGARFFPAVNQGELALIYCFLFFYFSARGAGSWTLQVSSRS